MLVRSCRPRTLTAYVRQLALLLPGEALGPAEGVAPPTWEMSIQNLCVRAMVLWHSSVRSRSASAAERSRFAAYAWLEADAIEGALDSHTCPLRAEKCQSEAARDCLYRWVSKFGYAQAMTVG